MSGQLLGWEVVWRQEDTRAWRTAAYALFNLPHVDEMCPGRSRRQPLPRAGNVARRKTRRHELAFRHHHGKTASVR